MGRVIARGRKAVEAGCPTLSLWRTEAESKLGPSVSALIAYRRFALLHLFLSDALQGAHSLLFLPEQVPYRVDSVKALQPQHSWGSFFAGLICWPERLAGPMLYTLRCVGG
jgi:hypothetical protein